MAEAPVELTRLEFDLLRTFLLNSERVLTREQLLEQVWGYDFAGDTRAVDEQGIDVMAGLRRDDECAA